MKSCPKNKILNPKTNRCVLRSGKIGKSIGKSSISSCPSNKIMNPKTKRCVKKSGSIGKKLTSRRRFKIPRSPLSPLKKPAFLRFKLPKYHKISKKDLISLKKKLSLDYNVCGSLLYKNNTEYIKISQNKNTSVDKKRMGCTTNISSKIIYHIHPIGTQIYPSTQDILKMMKMKNNNIENNLVITTIGIWNISCINKTLESQDDMIKVHKIIKKYVEKMYLCSSDEKIFNDCVYEIIKKLEKKLSKFFLFIRFDKWSDIKDDYVINK